MSVCVIGGGAGGLIAAKRLLDEGLSVVGFEGSAHLGGLWVYDSGPNGKMYTSLRANTCKVRRRLDGERLAVRREGGRVGERSFGSKRCCCP